jgi:hypothetical protein
VDSKFPRKVTRTAQYVAVPTYISLTPAFVSIPSITENIKLKERTITAIYDLLIGVKRTRITGINRTRTAIGIAMRRATILIRPG